MNQISLSIQSCSENVAVVRVTAAAFVAQSEITLHELEELKVAISEAVSNSVIHGYGNQSGTIDINMILYIDKLEISIIDHGRGIADVEQARRPSYSTDPERMGLGFVFMESFMDELEVISELGKGTSVRMVKNLQHNLTH